MAMIREWVDALPPAERVECVRVAYECVESFGANSPMGRAVRQAVIVGDVEIQPGVGPIGAGELLIYFDTFIGALLVTPPATVAIVHQLASVLEVHAPGVDGGWVAGDIRECWGALRRAIEERRAADRGADVAAAIEFITGTKPAGSAPAGSAPAGSEAAGAKPTGPGGVNVS